MNSKITTSTGKDLSSPNTWSFNLEVDAVADRDYRNTLPLALSGAEYLLDALIVARNEKIHELTNWVPHLADPKQYSADDIRECLKDEFVRLMNEIKALNAFIDSIAHNAAADLREAGNAILSAKKEAGND